MLVSEKMSVHANQLNIVAVKISRSMVSYSPLGV